ncbi:amidoligase domain [Cordyceps militaris]|uniref:Amidoligase domain n=1 Tax=Cordyceps militaris TaxID=73501 RepID=A0A2H4SFN8_CORMI|nr:amidoligase domain [Cordyceps militaris]
MWKRVAGMGDGDARARAEESEVYVAALRLVNKSRLMFYKAVQELMVKYDIPTGLSTSNYDTWTVVDERSLDEHPGYWRIELVSKKLRVTDDWQDQVDKVFTLVTDNCDVLLTTGCSMHIHVSPGPTSNDKYQIHQLQSILKAISVYDMAITSVMPADRKANPYAESDFAPIREQGYMAYKTVLPELLTAFIGVPQSGWDPVFKQFDATKNIQATSIHGLFFRNRYLSWNFSNLASECGTIEFRRPPGCQDAATAKHWVAFTLAFIVNAITTNWKETPYRTYGTVDQLSKFAANGQRLLPRTCHALRQDLLRPNDAVVVRYSKEEMTTINRKKEAQKDKMSSFVIKLNSRPNSPTDQ